MRITVSLAVALFAVACSSEGEAGPKGDTGAQ